MLAVELVFKPPGTGAEQETAAGYDIEAGDSLGRDDGLALHQLAIRKVQMPVLREAQMAAAETLALSPKRICRMCPTTNSQEISYASRAAH
jgi:hypothetical protein